MTRTILSCLFIFSLGFPLALASKEIKKENKKEKLKSIDVVLLRIGPNSLGLNDLKAQFKEVKITVDEAHMHALAELAGFHLSDILNTYLPEWKKSDGILVTALDGFKSDVPVAKILKYNPVLAYRFTKFKEFRADNKAQNEKDVDLGPYYLIWDNISFPELKREAAYDWPYQVVKLESIQYASHYAKSFPFKNPSEKERIGFEHFKNYCMTCHSVTGDAEGGVKGPILWPYPALFKGGLQDFKKWVLAPSSMRAGTSMPALNTHLTESERKEISERIYDYLSALHRIKKLQK